MSRLKLKELLDTEEKKDISQYKLYCDMDGVLTDFEERFDHFTGMHPQDYEKKHGTPSFWNLIDVKIGLRFWTDMNWMPEGQRLWNFIAPFQPTLLTSPSRDNTSRLGKNTWVKNNLPQTPKVIFAYSKSKQQYANENSILIDDKPSNIEEWEAAGGIAIRCKNGNVTPVIQKLKELGYE